MHFVAVNQTELDGNGSNLLPVKFILGIQKLYFDGFNNICL